MGIIKEKKEDIRKMIILKNVCKKYIWDLPYLLRIELSNFINLLDKQIIDDRNFINAYIKKQEQEFKQFTIYDYEDGIIKK